MKRKRITDPVRKRTIDEFKVLAKFIDYMAAKYRQSDNWQDWYTVGDQDSEELYAQDLARQAGQIYANLYRAEGYKFADLVYRDLIYEQAKQPYQVVIAFLVYIEEKKSISLDWLEWPTGKTLSFDETQGTVSLDDDNQEIIQLTPHQGAIMALITKANGEVVSIEEIGLALYGDEWYKGKVNDTSIDHAMSRLRQALGQNSGYIRTQKGEGWYLYFENREWKRAEVLARPVETALRSKHYDRETCTGFHFAVHVYNELAEFPLTVY